MANEVAAFRKAIAHAAYYILNGKVLAIDPGSNNLGWALYKKGKLVEAGVCTAGEATRPHKRILNIVEQLHDVKTAAKGLDVLAAEKLFRYNPALVWSVGAAIATLQPDLFVEVPVRLWQARVAADYVKSDEQDATEIGSTLIYHAGKL